MPRRDPERLARTRQRRAGMTPPERALWAILRAHRLEGVKFSRQVECGPFDMDFAARRHRLAIELDGMSHLATADADAARTAMLESRGWRVIRFTNADVFGDPDGVGRAILAALDGGGDPLSSLASGEASSPRWGGESGLPFPSGTGAKRRGGEACEDAP